MDNTTKEILIPPIHRLNDDALLDLFTFCTLDSLLALGRTCKRFQSLLQTNPFLWRNIHLSGSIQPVCSQLRNLTPFAHNIRSLHFLDIVFDNDEESDTGLKGKQLMNHDRKHRKRLLKQFTLALQQFLPKTLGSITKLFIEETPSESLQEPEFVFSDHPEQLFEIITKHVPNLKILIIASMNNLFGTDVSIPSLFTVFCPNITEFYESQESGLPITTLSHILSNWQSLTVLQCQTDYFSVNEFFSILSPARKRLRELRVASFVESIIAAQVFPVFINGLGILESLQTFSLDLELSDNCDGLDRGQWGEILERCGKLRNVEYAVSLDTYVYDESVPVLRDGSHQGYFDERGLLDRIRNLSLSTSTSSSSLLQTDEFSPIPRPRSRNRSRPSTPPVVRENRRQLRRYYEVLNGVVEVFNERGVGLVLRCSV